MNRKRTLIIILILFIGIFPLISVPIAKASEATVSIQESEDDVWMTESGNIFGFEASVRMLDPEIGIRSFLRFEDVPLLKSSKINLATLNVYAGFDQGEQFSPGASVTIYGIDEPDCAPFSYGGQVWSLERPYTSASVNWNVSDWHQVTWQAVNVTSIVKEIINQYAWTQNNSIGFQILGASDSGYEYRTFEDIDHQHHGAYAYLYIQYGLIDEEEDPPEDEYDFIEQYGGYTIWRRNGTGGIYYKDITIMGSPDGALEDYYIPIRVNVLSPFAENGLADPLYPAVYPSAVYHNGATYIVWQGDTGYDPYIIKYNHSTDTFSDPVKVGANPLSGDSHGAPVVMVDNQSYIHVFYGAHASALKYSKSDNPEDITAWTLQADPDNQCTYPHVLYDDGAIHLTYRRTSGALGDRVYRISEDNGATWGPETLIIEITASGDSIYATNLELYGIELHMVWKYYDPPASENVYHAYLNLTDNHMYSIDGTDMGASISEAESITNCLAVDSGVYDMHPFMVHLDDSGNPYIIYNVETDTARDIGFTRWTGAEWITPIILTETDEALNGMDFIVHSSTNITAFLVASGEAGRGGDIDRWTLSGTTWTEGATILSEAVAGMPLFSPKVVIDYVDELTLVFAEYGGIGVGSLGLYASDGHTVLSGIDSGRMVYLAGLSKSDFGDIRFSNYNGASQLEHWLEEKEDYSYALYWVKVPDIPASPGNMTIRIYWGDEEATSASTEAREDFTTYTELEEIDDIQKTAYHVDFIDSRARTTYLYKDYASNYFSNFSSHLNVKRVTHGDGASMSHTVMANVVKGFKQMIDDHNISLIHNMGGTDPKIALAEYDDGGNVHISTPQYSPNIALGTMYYLALKKYGKSVILDTYTTIDLRHAGGDGDFCHQNLTLTTDYSFQYNYVGNSYDDGGAQAGSSDMESQFFRDYVDDEPDIEDWGDLVSDGLDDEYFILDENGTLVDLNGNFTSLDDAQDALDDYTGGDPLDPDPGTQGWETEGPFTRFKMRLYFLVLGLGCIFGPIWAMAYKKMDSVGYAWCALIMIFGTGLLWSITGI